MICFVALAACRKEPNARDEIRSAPEQAKVVPAPQPPTPPSASASIDAGSTMPVADDTCAIDDDCEVLHLYLTGAQACCGSCWNIALDKRASLAIQAYCETRPSSNCPALDCPVLVHAECVAGHCKAK